MRHSFQALFPPRAQYVGMMHRLGIVPPKAVGMIFRMVPRRYEDRG